MAEQKKTEQQKTESKKTEQNKPEQKKQTEVSGNAAVNGNATAPARKPSEQALRVVDVAVGAVPEAADAVTKTVDQLRDPEARSQELQSLQHRVSNLRDSSTREAQIQTFRKSIAAEIEKAEARGGEIRKQVTDQVVAQARKAREQLEPVYRERVEPVYKERVEPVYKQRVEPVVRERVEPVYRERVEPTVKKALERV